MPVTPDRAPGLFSPEEIFLWYQKDFLAQQEAHQVVIVEKGRRTGITWADAGDSVLTASASVEARGQDCFYIGYNKDMAREYIETCADWARKFKKAIEGVIEEEILEDNGKEITVFRIRFPSQFKIEALSSRPSNLRGKQGKVTIDEAAFHEDLAGLVKAAIALLMWGGRVVIISTHEGEDNYFNELILDSRAGKTGYKVLRIPFQEALSQGLYKRICQVRGREWTQEAEDEWARKLYQFYGDNAAEELDAIPSGGTGSFLTRALIERQMRPEHPVVRLSKKDEFTVIDAFARESEIEDWCEEVLRPILDRLHPNLFHYFGEDFGRLGDLTAITVLEERQDLQAHAALTVELRNIPFEQQRQILFYIGDRLPRFIKGAMDARGNGQYLAEVAMQRYGEDRIECVMLSQPWYREHMPKMKAAFTDGTLTIPKDADILSDLRLIKVVKGVASVPDNVHTKSTDGGQRHGDTAIALALAIYASGCESESFGYDAVESRGSEWRKASNF